MCFYKYSILQSLYPVTYLTTGEVVELSDYDVNTVASLLKQYLRELPEPLLPLRLAPRLEAITSEFWSRGLFTLMGFCLTYLI